MPFTAKVTAVEKDAQRRVAWHYRRRVGGQGPVRNLHGGQTWTIDGPVFEMWLGSRPVAGQDRIQYITPPVRAMYVPRTQHRALAV